MLPAFLLKYGAEQLKQIGMTKRLHLQPIGSIHTTTGYEVEMTKTVDPTFLNILILIGRRPPIRCIRAPRFAMVQRELSTYRDVSKRRLMNTRGSSPDISI